MSTSQHGQHESTSFVFANIKPSSGIHHAISQLKHIPNVESITPVAGRFDLVIKLKTNDPEKAFNTVEKIREIEDISHTQTAISFQRVSNNEEEREQPIAFALMKVKGAIQETLRRLKTFPNIVEAHAIPGEFDVVAAFSGHSPREVMENSLDKIGSINEITASETLIAWNPTTSENRP